MANSVNKKPPDAKTAGENADVETMEVQIVPNRSSELEGAGDLLKRMDGIMPRQFNDITEPRENGIVSGSLSSSTIPDWILFRD